MKTSSRTENKTSNSHPVTHSLQVVLSQEFGASTLQGRFRHPRLFFRRHSRRIRRAMRLLAAWGLIGGLSLLVASPAMADEPGKTLAFKYHCRTCHGDGGRSHAQRYPKIAGQQKLYLETRLKYFREGVEAGNHMNAQAAPLSDEDIAILSDYYSRQSP